MRAGAAAPLLAAAQAPPERRMLSAAWDAARVGAALRPPAEWRPYTPARDRAGWARLPQALRDEAIARAEKALAEPWPTLPATLFLEFRREGNRARYEAVHRNRRTRVQTLAFAECCEGRGRFLDAVLDGLWLICEETYWGIPAHLNLQKQGPGLPDVDEPTVDLFAADTASLVAWTDYLLGPELDALSPLVRPRLAREVKRRILDVCLERDDFWWMGFTANRAMNNWTPWINSNWLTCVLLMENDAPRRAAGVAKIIRSLDRFLDAYHPDGGCDEGPGYWGHAGGSLFECLDLLHSASNGRIDFFHLPLVGEIGRYVYRAHIHEDWYVNFADASARTMINGDLVYRYGKRINDPALRAHGAWAVQRAAARAAGASAIARQLDASFHHEEQMKAEARPAHVRDVWLPGTQFFAARVKEGSAHGLYLAAQGGHNAESHNHNDVGNFIVYANGQPALIDVGVETYTAKTFSPQRYDIWTMQSAWHNLPTVNGVMQSAGRRFEARDCQYSADDNSAVLSMDIAAAWPEEAGLESWRRTFRLNRETGIVTISDNARFRRGGNEVEFNLITPCQPAPANPGAILLTGGPLGATRVDVQPNFQSSVDIDKRPIDDARLKPVWGETLWRVRLRTNAAQDGQWAVSLRIAG
jgi:hypothetical protein